MMGKIKIVDANDLERIKVDGEMVSRLDGEFLEYLGTEHVRYYCYTSFDNGENYEIRVGAPRGAEVAAKHGSTCVGANKYAVQVDYYAKSDVGGKE